MPDRDVDQALAALRGLTGCRCGPDWTERDRHEPSTACDYAGEVAVVAAEIARLRAIEQRARQATTASVSQSLPPHQAVWQVARWITDPALSSAPVPAGEQTPTADEVSYQWRVHSPGRGEFTDTDGFHGEEAARRFAVNDRAHGVESVLMRREVRRGPWVTVEAEEDDRG